ncbi:hypothetical protein F4814DRAFT_432735 [Daldinia grandis]|nr:hypothetical protein F4814DRAFT_432735 [Daldinia grandis]
MLSWEDIMVLRLNLGVILLTKVQSIPPIRYPMSVVSVVSSPNVMATVSPVKPKTSPGALVQPSLCQVPHICRYESCCLSYGFQQLTTTKKPS